MLIPNLATFTGLDPTTTPSLKHGNLDPTLQWASQELLDMAVGSLYIQKGATLGPNCTVLSSFSCLWIKVNRSQDPCNALGSPKDWRRCCCFNLIEGATPPQPSENPWCSAQTGDWYLQNDPNGCRGLWLKVKDTCGASDWYNVTGGKCLLTGTTPPDPVALCDYDLGAHYLDTSTHCPTLYIKIADNCNNADWLSLADGCIYDMAGSPVGNTTDTNLCELPIGAVVRDTTDTNRLYLKISDGCTGLDYQPLQLRLTKDPDLTGVDTINETTYVLNLAPTLIGHRRRDFTVDGRILVPPGAWLQVDELNDIRYDAVSALLTPMCPSTPNDAIYIPASGYWHIEARASWEGSATACNTGVAVGVGAFIYQRTINPALTFTESQNESHWSGNLTQGDLIHAWVTTDLPAGLQTGSIDLYARMEAPE